MNRWWIRLSMLARPEWPLLGALAGLSLLRVGFDVLRPWPMTLIVDCVLRGERLPPGVLKFVPPAMGQPRELLALLTLATIAIFLAGWGLRVAENYLRTGTASKVRYRLAGTVFDHLQRLSLRYHGRQPTGDLLKRITADTDCSRVLLIDMAIPLVTCIGGLVTMFLVMWRLDQQLAWVAIAATPLQVLAIWRFSKPMENASYAHADSQGEIMALAERTLAALPMVRAFGREEHEGSAFRRLFQWSDGLYLRAIRTQIQFRLGVEGATALGTAAVMLVGGWHVLEGRMSVGTLLVFVSYLAALYDPVETLAYMSMSFATASAGARRVFAVLDSDERLEEAAHSRAIGRLHGRVRFENVTAGYQPDRPVLKNISFDVKPGEMVAIVGRTGSGKTTLVSLIPRLLDPQFGRVLLDEIPLRALPLGGLRAQVSMLLQDPFLLPLPIAENIAYGKPEATRQEIERAAIAARADEFIRKLPEGYDTLIGQRGATLSGGERQRIAIARALLKDSPVLILDEPSSQLDAETEAELMDALDHLMLGRTTFVIAHRLSTVRKASQILVVDGGEIVESGGHEELLRLGGVYSQLHALQFGN